MKNRLPPNRSAQAAAIAARRERAASAPTTHQRAAAPSNTQPRRKPDDNCPACGAQIQEEGGLGCCGAITATCEGSIDGVPVDWDAVETDEESDRLLDAATCHDWYVDTRELIPTTRGGATEVPCRCER